MNRREAIRSFSLASGVSLLASTPSLAGVLASKSDASYAQALRGVAPVKIRDIKIILTAPNRIRLVVGYGAPGNRPSRHAQDEVIVPTNPRDIWEPSPYMRTVPELFE